MRLDSADKRRLMSCFSEIDLPDQEVYKFIKNIVKEGDYKEVYYQEHAFENYCIHYCGSVFFMARLNRKGELENFDEESWIEKGLEYFHGKM